MVRSNSYLFRFKQSFLTDWIAENNYVTPSVHVPCALVALKPTTNFKISVVVGVVEGASDSEGHAASIRMAVSPLGRVASQQIGGTVRR
jgi:hypothetical protein